MCFSGRTAVVQVVFFQVFVLLDIDEVVSQRERHGKLLELEALEFCLGLVRLCKGDKLHRLVGVESIAKAEVCLVVF